MTLQKCGLNLNRNRRELQPHGTIEFPCARFSSQYTNNSEYIIPWHWHEEMEVVYIVAGNMELQVPGKTFHLKKGESIFINSEILHFARAETYCKIHSFVFHPTLIAGKEDSIFFKRYIEPLIHLPTLDGYPFTLEHKWERTITNNIITAFEAMSLERLGYEFIVRENLSHICFSLYQQLELELENNYIHPNMDHIRIRKMLDFIQEHYSENLDLPEIAKSANIGVRECLRCFQRDIQISPIQYLIKYRITQGASMLLKNPNVCIADISFHCGFDSPSNFTQMFKRFYKCTPKEYRKGIAAKSIVS